MCQDSLKTRAHKRLAIFDWISIMHKVTIIKKFWQGWVIATRASDILLEVKDLQVSFFTDTQELKAVDGVSFPVNRGEVFGIVGESGCGKTVTSLSVMRLVPPPGRIVGGEIILDGTDLLRLPVGEMEKVRGGRIGMVFQEPMTSLNPVFRVGDQIAETLLVHTGLNRKEVKDRAVELLTRVGFDKPDRSYLQYPHQLSGGQRQRVLIAIAISCNPSLVIADEPTTALDVATEFQILSLLQELVARYEMSMILITHNLSVIKRLGMKMAIMYAGRILELGGVEQFFAEPLHPYSKGLLDSVFKLEGSERRLKAIPGSVPRLSELPKGCKFSPRCAYVMDRCREDEPLMREMEGGRWVRCYLYQN
jgi:oligopeptide/dipeptide ABC transporter ATP-binding protein